MVDFCYSGHFLGAPREHFGQNLSLNSGHILIDWENREHIRVFV